MTSYQSLLQKFKSLGGRPELFGREPTEAELWGLTMGMAMLKEKYPRFWRVEK